MGMLNIIKADTRGEVIGKCYTFRRYYLSKSTTDMPIDGSRWGHPKRWLYPMHEMWSAEGGCQSLRHNFQYVHISTLPIPAKRHSRHELDPPQIHDKHLVDDVSEADGQKKSV